jgi:hypothetical protein
MKRLARLPPVWNLDPVSLAEDTTKAASLHFYRNGWQCLTFLVVTLDAKRQDVDHFLVLIPDLFSPLTDAPSDAHNFS